MTTVRFKVDLGPRQARTVAAPAGPSASSAPSGAPASPAARVLGLAHWIEREVRAGRFTSYRDAARHLGVSHARVQHVVGLVFLPPKVQAVVLSGSGQHHERELRLIAATSPWPHTG